MSAFGMSPLSASSMSPQNVWRSPKLAAYVAAAWRFHSTDRHRLEPVTDETSGHTSATCEKVDHLEPFRHVRMLCTPTDNLGLARRS